MTLKEVIRDYKDRGYKINVFEYCPTYLWSREGHIDEYSWCDGTSRDGVIYEILLSDGKLLEVPPAESGSTGSGESWEYEGLKIADFLKEESINQEDVKYIIEREFSYCTWEARNEKYIVNIYPVKPLDVKKVRRRIEDRLRKSNSGDIIATAVFLDVRLD